MSDGALRCFALLLQVVEIAAMLPLQLRAFIVALIPKKGPWVSPHRDLFVPFSDLGEAPPSLGPRVGKAERQALLGRGEASLCDGHSVAPVCPR